KRPPDGSSAAISYTCEAGRDSYFGATWFTNQSGRNSAKVTRSRRTTSSQEHFARNHAMVAAAKASEATVAPNTTMVNSHQPDTSMRSNMGLKMNMKGRTAVRMA